MCCIYVCVCVCMFVCAGFCSPSPLHAAPVSHIVCLPPTPTLLLSNAPYVALLSKET